MATLAPSDPPPEGFVPLEPFGAFQDLVGPFHELQRGDRTVVGLRVAEKHLGRGPGIHGGMYMALLDIAMTRACVRIRPADRLVVTTSFSSELIGAARAGDWIEAEVEVLRAGGRVYFLNTLVRRDGPDGDLLVRGSATFQLIQRPPPAPDASPTTT